MKIVTDGVGRLVLKQLATAVEVKLEVAYFCLHPQAEMFEALTRVPVTLIVSEEFSINNPYTLEKLAMRGTVLSIPVGDDTRKLHAKVLIATRSDGSRWVLIGSANMTAGGMFSNQEAGVAFDDTSEEFEVEKICKWFDSLKRTARRPDFPAAKLEYDLQASYRLERRPVVAGVRCWALKTTAGSDGTDYWEKFKRDGVIAIGWTRIGINPSNVPRAELEAVLSRIGDNEPKGAARKIKTFVDLEQGNLILICKGYSPNQRKPVWVYGFARVNSGFQDTEAPGWPWRFKHDAIIQLVERPIPKEAFAKALGMGSLRLTIHELDETKWARLIDELSHYGVQLRV